jgi:MFS family permease
MQSVFYGWRLTAGGTLNNFLLSAVTFWGFGLFVRPLHEEFGWSTALIAAGFSVRSFQQGFLAPFLGTFIDRVGPRAVIVAGTLLLAAGLALFAEMHSVTMYFVSSILIALGSSGPFSGFTAVVMRWFVTRRGRAMGILNAGNGAGYVLVPGLAFLVTSMGWRHALLVCAALVLVVGLPVGLAVRDDPAALGLRPDGATEPQSATASGDASWNATGATVREALHTRAFYLISFALAMSGGVVNAWTVHTIPHLQHVGFSLGTTTLIGVGYAGCQVCLRPATGVLGDRIGRRNLFVAGFVFLAVGMVVFAYLTPDRVWLLPLYYGTFAVGQAVWVVLQAATVADYFGPRNFATIFGLTNLAQMPLGVAAPIAAGWAFDHTGTYVPVFILLGIGVAFAAIAMLAAKPPARPALSATPF